MQHNGNKIHLTWCKDLEKRFNQDVYDEYIFTTDKSGIFKIKCLDEDGTIIERKVKLWACHHCLEKLILNTSVASKFLFNYKEHEENYKKKLNNFSSNNKLIDSKLNNELNTFELNFIEKNNHQCDCCKRKFDEKNKDLLNVYYLDGDKSNLQEDNLKILCKLCHKEKPIYKDVLVSINDINRIKNIKR